MPPHKVRIPKGLVYGPWMTTGPHPPPFPPPPPPPPHRPPGPPNRRPPVLTLSGYSSLLEAWTDFMRLMKEDPWSWVVRGAVHVIDGTFDTPLDDDVDISYLAFCSYMGLIADFLTKGTTSDDAELHRFETFLQKLGYHDLTEYIRVLLSTFFDTNNRQRRRQTNSSIRAVVYHLMPLLFFSNLNYVSNRVVPPELWQMRDDPSVVNLLMPYLTEWVIHDVFLRDRRPYPPLPVVTGEPLSKRQRLIYRPDEVFMEEEEKKRNREYRRQLRIEHIERRLSNLYGGIFDTQVDVLPELNGEQNVEVLIITFNDGTEMTVRLRY